MLKRLLKWLGILGLSFLIALFVVACFFNSGGEELQVDNLAFYTHRIGKTCFAGCYYWNIDSNYAVLDIPNSCDGYRVTELGGFIGIGGPCPFTVVLPDTKSVHNENTLPVGSQVEQYHLVINLGQYRKEDEFVHMKVYHRLEDDRFVQILVSVNCSEDNRYFYSLDGKLYRRKDDTLVDNFFYYSDHD